MAEEGKGLRPSPAWVRGHSVMLAGTFVLIISESNRFPLQSCIYFMHEKHDNESVLRIHWNAQGFQTSTGCSIRECEIQEI